MRELAKVWTLEWCEGVDPETGRPVELAPFSRGWMPLEDARTADAEGKVQLLAGLDGPSMLGPDRHQPRERQTYERADLQARQLKTTRGRPKKNP